MRVTSQKHDTVAFELHFVHESFAPVPFVLQTANIEPSLYLNTMLHITGNC